MTEKYLDRNSLTESQDKEFRKMAGDAWIYTKKVLNSQESSWHGQLRK